MTSSSQLRLGVALLLYALVLSVIWIPIWPTGADLPQHAAQVATLLRWGDPADGATQSLLRLNLLTPYLLGYGLTAASAAVFGVPTALRIVLSVVVITTPLAARSLLREAGAAPQLWLLTIPAMLGFPMAWGLLNFLVGLPLIVGFWTLGLRYSRSSSLRGAVGIATIAALLVGAHALTALLGAGVAGFVHLARGPIRWRTMITALPFTAPLPVIAIWIGLLRSSEVQTTTPVTWDLSPLRVVLLLAYQGGGEVTLAGIALGALLFVAPLVAGFRLTSTRWRLVPLVLLGIAFLAIPAGMLGTAFLADRLAPLVFLAWLLAFDAAESVRSWRLLTASGLAVLLLVPAVLGAVRVREDQTDLAAVLEQLPPHQRILSLPIEWRGLGEGGFQQIHASSWYVTQKGGVVEFSFAYFYPQVVRYRPGAEPPLPFAVEIVPSRYTHDPARSPWDLAILLGDVDHGPTVFGPEGAELLVHEGKWWAYRLRPAPAQP